MLTVRLSVPWMVTQREKDWWMELSLTHESDTTSHMWKCRG